LKNSSAEKEPAPVFESRAHVPLSITAIGLYMLFGACLMPINIFAHAPAFLIGIEFRGWAAIGFFLAMGTLDAVIGIGLLRLAGWSRIGAICFFLFRAVNTAVTFLLPGSRTRFQEGVALMQGSAGGTAAPRHPVWFGPVFILSVMAVVLWLLFTQKKAFLAPGEVPPLVS
jgi:hypothetical protein